MNLDKYGLPVQADGDANDQLQRIGMILTAAAIIDKDELANRLEVTCIRAIQIDMEILQPSPGIFLRHVNGDPKTVSADQLIAILGFFTMSGVIFYIWPMFKQMMKRFGFAQNTKDGLDGKGNEGKTKMPDFMLIRALPLFLRAHWCLYPILLLSDALLVLSALSAVGPVWKDGGGFKTRSPDDVDDNNTILTLSVCRVRFPTPLVLFAVWIFAKLRPWNHGCVGRAEEAFPLYSYKPVYGALRWYHRAEAGGNPEIAEMWKPICERYFQ